MDAGEQLVAEVIEAITSGRDVYVFNQYVQGSDLAHARRLLLEKRSTCADPDVAAFLTSIIEALEKQSAP
jgi:hypothetical protein